MFIVHECFNCVHWKLIPLLFIYFDIDLKIPPGKEWWLVIAKIISFITCWKGQNPQYQQWFARSCPLSAVLSPDRLSKKWLRYHVRRVIVLYGLGTNHAPGYSKKKSIYHGKLTDWFERFWLLQVLRKKDAIHKNCPCRWFLSSWNVDPYNGNYCCSVINCLAIKY